MTTQEFLAWENASRDTIDVKRCYIDMADGDLVAGILLSQILYWHLPGEDGRQRLRVEYDGEMWLAKCRKDWWDECRIKPKQFDRACELLERLGIVKTIVKRFNGSPTKHIRVCWEAFLRDLANVTKTVTGGKMEVPKTGRTKCANREERSAPSVKNEMPVSANSLTETSSENTQRIHQSVAASPPVSSFSYQERRAEADRKKPGGFDHDSTSGHLFRLVLGGAWEKEALVEELRRRKAEHKHGEYEEYRYDFLLKKLRDASDLEIRKGAGR